MSRKQLDGYLPKDLTAERFCLGSVLLDPECLNGEFPAAEDFLDPQHKTVASMIHAARERGMKADSEAVYCLASERKQLDKIGGEEFLHALLEAVPHGGSAKHYAQLVQGKATRRRLILKARDAMDLAADETVEIPDVIEHFEGLTAHFRNCGSGTNALRAVCAADVTTRPVEWLWKNRIARGKTTLFVGQPGCGKSFSTTDLAARISRGAPFPDGSPSPIGDVMIFAAEDAADDTIVPRLKLHGADLKRVHIVTGVGATDPETGKPHDRGVRLDLDIAKIRDHLQKYVQTILLIFDPISEYLGKTDSHKNDQVRAVLSPMTALADEFNLAVVNVTHFNKTGIGPAMYKAMGSLAFTAQARAAWAFIPDADDQGRILFLPLKNNLAKKMPGLAFRVTDTGIVWEDGDVETTADDAMANLAGGDKRGNALDKALAWLKQRLADGKEVESDALVTEAKEAGISFSTYKRAKDDLGVKSRKGRAWEGGKWHVWLEQEAHVEPVDIVEPLEPLEPVVEGWASPDKEAQEAQEDQQSQEDQEVQERDDDWTAIVGRAGL